MSEWINVEERLPESFYPDQVLVYIMTMAGWGFVKFASWMPPDDGNTELAGMKLDPRPGYWELEGNPEEIPFKVTHWMPLPELPK